MCDKELENLMHKLTREIIVKRRPFTAKFLNKLRRALLYCRREYAKNWRRVKVNKKIVVLSPRLFIKRERKLTQWESRLLGYIKPHQARIKEIS